MDVTISQLCNLVMLTLPKYPLEEHNTLELRCGIIALYNQFTKHDVKVINFH